MMRRALQFGIVLGLALGACAPVAHARKDPLASLKKLGLVPDHARVVQLATGFGLTEGPTSDARGNVYFSDIPANRIYLWWAGDWTIVIFRTNTGGANGLFLDRNGHLFACEGKNRRVVEIDREGNVRVLADQYQGRKLNSPNDLWVAPDGGVYFTDPRYGKRDDLEQDGEHVYYISPNRDRIVRVIDDLVRPNGIIGTPDGRLLYVADEGAGRTYVYDIQQDGTLANRRLFAEQRSDGMTLDEKGNLYLTGRNVVVYDPSGRRLGEIPVPERPTNLCFGGRKGDWLFITARSSVYGLQMRVRGSDRAR